MARLILEQVTQKFGRQVAVADVSLHIPDGEFWVLMGPSGCGKSTILRTVAGLLPVQQGRIWLGERCVNQVPARERDVAMVFQNYALYPHMTVAENLAFGLKMRGVPPQERQRRVRWVAELLGLTELLQQNRGSYLAANNSGWLWGERWCGNPRCFYWMNLCRTWTPVYGTRPAPNSNACTSNCPSPRSMSPMTRRRP